MERNPKVRGNGSSGLTFCLLFYEVCINQLKAPVASNVVVCLPQ